MISFDSPEHRSLVAERDALIERRPKDWSAIRRVERQLFKVELPAEQLDIDGNAQPIEPPPPSGKHEQPKMFDSTPTTPGQMVL